MFADRFTFPVGVGSQIDFVRFSACPPQIDQDVFLPRDNDVPGSEVSSCVDPKPLLGQVDDVSFRGHDAKVRT
jgi:hypothetical protein